MFFIFNLLCWQGHVIYRFSIFSPFRSPSFLHSLFFTFSVHRNALTFMATYSAFFSSGLLAQCHFPQSRAHTPTPNSSGLDQDTLSLSSRIMTHTKANIQTPPSVPYRLRRRRGSLSTSASAIKSPAHNASVAFQRARSIGAISPRRYRSGSVGSNHLGGTKINNNAVSGRKRSGSLGVTHHR